MTSYMPTLDSDKKLSSKLKSSFVLASEIPLPWGQNFSIIPWFNPLFSHMGEVGQNIDRCINFKSKLSLLSSLNNPVYYKKLNC